MRNSTPLLTLTVLAAGAIVSSRFVAPSGIQTGAGLNALGVARSDAVTGERFAVDAMGTAIVETGAAIAANALIEADASGRAITKASGLTLARLAPGEVATASGQFVEVILLPN